MEKIFTLVKNVDVEGLRSLGEDDFRFWVNDQNKQEEPFSVSSFLVRDQKQETHLAVSLRCPESAQSAAALSVLLENGGAKSVFVKGYSVDSLMCTLPMAEQPESSVHVWPAPIGLDRERLHMLDVALADHIKWMAEDAAERRALAERQALEKQREEDAAKKAASAAPSIKPAFNHYPDALVVGNIVRRGPDWSYSDQDVDQNSGTGTRAAGIVTTVSSSTSVKVEWRRNVNDPSTAFHLNSYKYQKGGPYDIFLVDINQPSAAPANAPGGANAVQTREKFKVGDKVCLVDHGSGTSLVTSKPHLKDVSARCLGISQDGRVGVIVDVSGAEVQYQNPAGQAISDFTVNVMSLKGGAFCEYAMGDLRYADGSNPGFPRASQLNPCAVPGSGNATATRATSAFVAGDRVMLRPGCADLRGCLYLPHLNFVGVVSAASSSRVGVHCYDCKRNPAWQAAISGNYPNHTYDVKDLILESDSSLEPRPLVMGDIVTLDDSFAETSGWCLGTVADKRTGIVRFAPSANTDADEQRDVLISSLADPKKVYSYRGKWLVRHKADPRRYKLGDRVKLDIATARSQGKETAGKCLGLPTQGNYGLVCGLGNVRDGLQRNIEVVSASGSRAGTVSLYPSYSLMPATRLAVLLDDEMPSLIAKVSEVLMQANMQAINAEQETRRLGLEVWNYLGTVPQLDKDKIFAAWQSWKDTRSSSWSASEPDVSMFGYKPPAAPAGEILFWQCTNANCKVPGGFAENDIKMSKCSTCKAPAPKWTCECCSTKNKVNTDICVTCYENRSASAELAKIKVLEKAEEERVAAAEAERKQREKDALVQETHKEQLGMMKKEREALEAEAAAAGMPRSAIHPGSFQACGGNPTGRARCVGKGVCSTGVSSCEGCGRATHWTCCSSKDSKSLCCPATVARKVAKRNAKVLFLASSNPEANQEVNQIRGYSPIDKVTHWACPACTSVNDNGRRTCGMCESERPAEVEESYEDIWAEMEDVSDDEEEPSEESAGGAADEAGGAEEAHGAAEGESAKSAPAEPAASAASASAASAAPVGPPVFKFGEPSSAPTKFPFSAGGGSSSFGGSSSGLFKSYSPPMPSFPVPSSFNFGAAPKPLDGAVVTCHVGHKMIRVKPDMYPQGKCEAKHPCCAKRPVHYHCFECKGNNYDMCKPCYRHVLRQKQELQEEGFRGARVSAPLARLAEAVDCELRNAKADKAAARVVLLSGGADAGVRRVSVPMMSTVDVFNGADAASRKISSLASGCIVEVNPSTAATVGSITRMQLTDGSGWIAVQDGDRALVVEEPDEEDEDEVDEEANDDDDNNSDNDSNDSVVGPNQVDYNDGDDSLDAEQRDGSLPDDLESKKNNATAEKIFMKEMHTHHPSAPRSSESGGLIGPPLSGGGAVAGGSLGRTTSTDSIGSATSSPSSSRRAPLMRQGSDGFFRMSYYEQIIEIEDLVRFVDKNGNTAAHYAMSLGMQLTYDALRASGADAWKRNATFDTPAGLKYMPMRSGEAINTLFTHLALRSMVPEAAIVPALRCDFAYSSPGVMEALVKAIKDGAEDDAAYYAEEAVLNRMPHALLYRAVFRLEFNYGPLLARQDLDLYMRELCDAAAAGHATATLDPLYHYATYLLWKKAPSGRPSHNKVDRLRAFDALRALRLFPRVCALWLDPREKHDEDMAKAGDTDVVLAELEEDDYSDLLPPPAYHDPEMVWERAKVDHNLVSPSMDKLMQMTGLKRVKETAITVALNVLLKPPPDIKTGTSMNFLFLGNPGSGKTSVAKFLGQAMVELKYRTNPTPVFTEAGDILGAQSAVQEFARLVKDAEGGMLFIDEAYMFEPAPKGKQGNDSNKVLDALMKSVEALKLTTSFILAGYKEDLLKVISYNPGFESRFAKQFRFEFDDFSELQMTKILVDMTKERGLRFETKKQCGAAIARVMARTLMKGVGKKDFGNGRLCEKCLEACIVKQKDRLARLLAEKIPVSDDDYRVLTRGDTIGERPNLQDSPYMAELMGMVGLDSVKQRMNELMQLQLINHDRKMQGEPPIDISLHRVFLGNPGTGKTTVAKLFGKMLKAFGLLSDGDFIMVTPSDLKGSAVGEAGERTRALLESAKGKVLFIDEAYNLDPKRSGNIYGAEVIDTLLEKIEGNAGSDMCVIMAGYKPQMEQFFRNANNEGLKRRLNLGEAFTFDDFTDEQIKKVLKAQVVNAGLTCEPSTLDFAVKVISKKRMEDGFGNAGEAEQILTRAKLRISQRASRDPSTNFKLLLEEDFAGEETSSLKAREAFAGLEHIEHIEAVLNKFEAMVATATEEGRKPHEEMANMHMLFLGPPGTGKTTCAKRFAVMLRQLDVLPTDKFEYTTAGNLIDRYVGGTGNNTLDAMRRAKGGILFIDEAYGMLPGRGNLFGSEIVQALLDNVTSEEYAGKIIIILGGYKEHVEELFAVNPGFQSRFDKMRVEFPEWTGDQAASAVISAIEKEGKSMTEEAKAALPTFFNNMRELPNWASARDAMEIIKKNLEMERSQRSYQLLQERRLLEEASSKGKAGGAAAGGGPSKNPNGMRSGAARAQAPPPIPFELSDLTKVFEAAIRNRGGELGSSLGEASVPTKGVKTIKNKVAFKQAVDKTKTEQPRMLVMCFTQTESCHYSRTFSPKFAAIADSVSDDDVLIEFAVTEAEDVMKQCDITGVPCTRIYHKGKQIGPDVRGDNEAGLRAQINTQLAIIKKTMSNTPSLPPPVPMPHGPAHAPPPPKLNHNVNVQVKKAGDDDGDEDDSEDDNTFWAALEEACNQLGWDLGRIKAMLEDAANFPPPEILQIIMAKTGCTDVGKIKRALVPQRAKHLDVVKKAIKENERAKSAEEAKVQEALRCIGQCCMGYDWLKIQGGYQCAGGSHFCTDAEVSQQLLR